MKLYLKILYLYIVKTDEENTLFFLYLSPTSNIDGVSCLLVAIGEGKYELKFEMVFSGAL
jgi:hypothetical protein